MTENFKHLLDLWSMSGIDVCDAAGESDLIEFENRCGVILPKDFKCYFSTVNGMPKNMWDESMIRFWPLQEIRTVKAEYEAFLPEYRSVLDVLANPDGYFLFADYLCGSHLYAICLKNCEEGRVIYLDDESYNVVAGSFSEFIEKYMNEIDSILVPGV